MIEYPLDHPGIDPGIPTPLKLETLADLLYQNHLQGQLCQQGNQVQQGIS
jgi:hypothetical protein